MLLIRNNRTYGFYAPFVFAILFLAGAGVSRAQTVQSPVQMPNPPTPVVDQADIIDAQTEQRLNNILKNLSENKQANVEMAVVTVKTLNGQDVFDYSLAIMRGWGIGSSTKGGLLLFVAIEDRQYNTQVSRHLEGDLPDGLVGQIQRDKLVPLFNQGNYSQAIADTVETYIATLAEKRGFSVEGIDQRKAYRPRSTRPARETGSGFSTCGVLLIILIVVIVLLANRRGGGGGGGGCLNLLFLGSLLSSGNRGSSGWMGGGFGGGGSDWGGSGGGSDWGGFSGGGGDAGGGGAGGSW